MNSIGIVRKVDELGRIVIPKETREQLSVAVGDPLEIYIEETDNSIILKKYAPGCTFCSSFNNISTYKGVKMCEDCLAELKSIEK